MTPLYLFGFWTAWRTPFSAIPIFPLCIVHCSEGESDAAYLERKLQVLRQICTLRHLILLDNFDTGDCENLDFLTELPCPILVTSRVDYDGIFPQ